MVEEEEVGFTLAAIEVLLLYCVFIQDFRC